MKKLLRSTLTAALSFLYSIHHSLPPCPAEPKLRGQMCEKELCAQRCAKELKYLHIGDIT